MSNELKHATHHNPKLRLPKDIISSMKLRWDRHLEQKRKMAELEQLTMMSAEERTLRNRLHESQLRGAGADDALLKKIRGERSRRAKLLMEELKHLASPYNAPQHFPDPPHVMDEPVGSAEMWWGQTNWSWNDPGIVPFWDDAAGLRFAGEIPDFIDEYMRRNLTVNAQFFLGSDRVPSSLLGNVTSAPSASVVGAVRGVTLSGLWDFGDQWCKCWLNLSQTAFVKIPGVSFPFFGDWLPIASNSSVITLIYIDGDGVSDNFFPGPIQMPVVQFPLGAGWDVQIDLQFWFDIQLEGDNTDIIFGDNAQFQSNLVQTFQWNLTNA